MKPHILSINEKVRMVSSCPSQTQFGFENHVTETLIRLGTDRLQATQETYQDGTVVLKYIWPGPNISVD